MIFMLNKRKTEEKPPLFLVCRAVVSKQFSLKIEEKKRFKFLASPPLPISKHCYEGSCDNPILQSLSLLQVDDQLEGKKNRTFLLIFKTFSTLCSEKKQNKVIMGKDNKENRVFSYRIPVRLL